MPSQPAAFALAKCMAEDCQETVYVKAKNRCSKPLNVT